MEAIQATDRQFSSKTIGRIRLGHSKFLIPDMNRATTHLLAATLRSFDIDAHVLPTYKGLDFGKKFTSGKECYPCLVTLGDLLYFIEEEKQRLGKAFQSGRYVFFMPESEGPCRFGMYNKYQRLVLDSFPELRELRITAATTTDGYSPEGIFDAEHVRSSKKAACLAMVLGDVMDRFIWRVRPYEKAPGRTDALAGQALHRLAGVLEQHGADSPLDRVLRELDEILAEGRAIIDSRVAPKPRIGIVGEIFLRMHQDSNQDLIRVLERYGAEVVNASMGEWLNYVSYDGLRQARRKLRLGLKLLRPPQVKSAIKEILSFGIPLLYQERLQKQVFKRARRRIDIAADHKIGNLEKILKQSGVFSFDIPTEACLSIPGIMHCACGGYNGVVNVYPFACMPSTTTSAVVRPLMHEWRFPYLDTPYDGSCQPNREAAIRTFMYQAEQHLARHGRGT
ncbi:MAG: CoA activase [Deltaproteobacteria bacterium]|nr:CoA activase [Deltaproteobacteria bacterium]